MKKLFLFLTLTFIIIITSISFSQKNDFKWLLGYGTSNTTNAKKLGVPTAIISEALGHKTENITQVYLDSFDNDVVDKYHELVINISS